MQKVILFLLIFIVHGFHYSAAYSQEQKKLSITDLEQQFIQKNYQLLAAKYSIEKADAEILQSKLWKNPSLSISQVNLWSNTSADDLPYLFGNYGNHQQFAFDLEQVIETAGKRRKRVDLKTTEKNTVLLEFEQLVRELKMNLRLAFIDLQQITQEKKQLSVLLDYYSELSEHFRKQMEKQNFSKAEYYRIQTAYIDLKQQLINWNAEEAEALQQLKILTQIPNLTTEMLEFGEYQEPDISRKIPEDIIESAKDSSILKQHAQQQLLFAEQQLKLEKANASPDVKILMNYDRGGSMMRDFFGIGIGIDLPFFDRNQGNIKSAQAQLEQQKYQLTSLEINLETSITKLIQQLRSYEELLSQFPKTSFEEFQTLIESYIRHLKNKQVSLFEFIDFTDAYVKAQGNYFSVEKNYLRTFEQLQYLIGKDL